MKADKIVLGNVITMDEHKPRAEAVAVKDGAILYVGSADVAKRLCDADAEVLDYGNNSIYPGFLEAHCHPGLSGLRTIGQANLFDGATLEDYVRIMQDYMEEYPEKEVYLGAGWTLGNITPDACHLDAICPDKPMVLQSADAHSMWLNTAAMERFGIDRAAVERLGASLVRVHEDGSPTGFISETPVQETLNQISHALEDAQSYLLWFQDFMQSNGFTAVYDAGLEIILGDKEAEAYKHLQEDGKMTLRVFGAGMVADNNPEPEKAIDHIAALRDEMNGDYFKIIGAKVFCDGVVEAHTAWLTEDYDDQPGNTGLRRWCDHDLMVRLIVAASKHGMNVHAHSFGDGATKYMVDAIEEAQAATGNYDQRNALAHLHLVSKRDIQRFADNNIMATAALLWASRNETNNLPEMQNVGKDRTDAAFPVRSFIDAGAVVQSHSDYPVSTLYGAPLTVCSGVLRKQPSDDETGVRNVEGEGVSRLEALKAITTNVAYAWHEEGRMGSLEIGKLANMAVFDADFLEDDLDKVVQAKCLATIIDGKVVYQA